MQQSWYQEKGQLFQSQPFSNVGYQNIVLFGTPNNQQNKELLVLSYFLLT